MAIFEDEEDIDPENPFAAEERTRRARERVAPIDPGNPFAHEERERRALVARRDTVSATEDFGRGALTGLADTGYSLAQGLTYLANKLPGVNLDRAESALAESRQEAREFYDPRGTAGTVGNVTGRVLGEGATFIAEGAGVGKLLRAVAPGARLTKAIQAGRAGSLGQRAAANLLPAAPLDFAIGAGDADPNGDPATGNTNPVARALLPQPGDSRVVAGLKNVATGAILPVGIEVGTSAARTVRAVRSAGDELADGVLESGFRNFENDGAPGESLALEAPPGEFFARRDRLNDPLSAANVAARRLDAAAAEATAERTRTLGISQGEPAVVQPEITGRFDAEGRPVYDFPGQEQGPALPPAPEPLTRSVLTFDPQETPAPLTTQTRQLDASRGRRFVEDGPASLSTEGVSGADFDAVQRIERAAGQYTARRAALPDGSPIIAAPPVIGGRGVVHLPGVSEANAAAEAAARQAADAAVREQVAAAVQAATPAQRVLSRERVKGTNGKTARKLYDDPIRPTRDGKGEWREVHQLTVKGLLTEMRRVDQLRRSPVYGNGAQRVALDNRTLAVWNELNGRGIDDELIVKALDDGGESAIERAALQTETETVADDAANVITDDDGKVLFSHPTVGGAVIGGAIGASEGETDEERTRNLLRGFAIGAGGAAAARAAAPAVARATRGVRAGLADAIAPELRAERRVLDRAANSDELTGLGNVRAYRNILTDAEANPNVKVIRFDVNGMKGVNDALGHEAGDGMLRSVALAIRTATAEHGLGAFRVGGDEFAVVAPANLADQVRTRAEELYGVVEHGNGVKSSLSGGVGDTDKLADADAYTRKAQHKAVQGIAARGAVPGQRAAHSVGAAVAGLGAGATDDGNPQERFEKGLATAAALTVGGVAAYKVAKLIKAPAAGLTPLTPGQSSALGRVRKNIDFDGGLQKAIAKEQRGSLLTRVYRFADKLANGAGALERLGAQVEGKLRPTQNPKYLVSYVKSGERTIQEFFETGVVDPITRETSGPSFKSIFEPLGQDDAAIQTGLAYAKAKRDVGRGLAGVGGDAQQLADAHELVRYGDNDPKLREFAQRWESFVEGVGQYAVKSGLWTPEMWSAMRQSDAFYVRYKRLVESSLRKAKPFTPAGSKMANVTSGVQSFEGSGRAIENPAVALAEYAAAVIRRADRYRVGASLFDAADELGDAGQLLLTRVPAPKAAQPVAAAQALQTAQANVAPDIRSALDDVFNPQLDPKNPVIWRNGQNGEREYAVLHSQELFDALGGLNPKEPDAIRRVLDVSVRPLRRIFTAATTGLSPRFSLATNIARDVVDAFAKTQSRVGFGDMAKGYYEGVLSAFGKSDIADEAALSGLGGTSLFGGELNPAAVARRYAPTSTLDKVRSGTRQAVGSPVHLLERVGEASDRSPRLAEYMAAIRQAEAKIKSGEWTPADARLFAATRARGVTIDFANKPGSATLRFLDDYIPFFGVALKAPVSFAQAASRSPARVAAVASGVAASSAIAWAMTHALSDEARGKVRDRMSTERAGFLLAPLDGTGENLLRIPLGAELGVVHGVVTSALDKVMEDDPHAGQLFAESVVRALPPGIGEALIDKDIVVPIPGVQQVIENARNKRAFGGAPVEAGRLQELPPSERRYDTTAPTFDALAAGARAAGFENVSPLQAENVARGVFSQATPFITAITDPVAERVTGRAAGQRVPLPLSRHPVNPASAVVANPVPATTESERDFYKLSQRAREAQNLYNAAEKSGDESAIPALREMRDVLNPDVQSGLEVVGEVLKEIREQEQAIRIGVQRGTIKPLDGRRQLDAAKLQRQTVYRNAMRVFREMGVNP